MDLLFLEAPYTGEIKLSAETINYIKTKNYQTIALYASVQFVQNLNAVKEQLAKENINIIASQPKRAHVPSQLLGCDMFHDSFNLSGPQLQSLDAYLYIGDGRFHPLALIYTQRDVGTVKEIICYDPMRKAFSILGLDQVKKAFQRYNASLMKFLSARNIGVVISIKPGQEYLKRSFQLEEQYPEKKFYYFVDDIISFHQLENFNFIEIWVNTACPRVGVDDQEKFAKGVINLTDAFRAKEIIVGK